MKPIPWGRTHLQIMVAMIAFSFTFTTIVACDQPQQAAASQTAASVAQVVAVTNTVIAKPTKSSDIEEFRKQLEQWQTVTALTPTQPRPIWPPPGPTPTWELGMLECGASASHYDYQFNSCWSGVLNNKLITVGCAGLGRDDPTQGYVLVFNGPYLYPYNQVYAVSIKVGMVKIVSANGAILTLTTTDPRVTPTLLYFDIATRQFAGASGSPIPTTPVPTTTP